MQILALSQPKKKTKKRLRKNTHPEFGTSKIPPWALFPFSTAQPFSVSPHTACFDDFGAFAPTPLFETPAPAPDSHSDTTVRNSTAPPNREPPTTYLINPFIRTIQLPNLRPSSPIVHDAYQAHTICERSLE